jgi:F-type H+-transporting ATPase subunit b
VESILHQIGVRWPVLLLQLLGFLIMFAILKFLLFDRVRRFMAAREEEERRERHELEAARKHLEAAEAKLKSRIAEVEKQAYEQTQAEVRAGLKRKADIVQEAQDRARAELERARSSVAAERAKGLERLKGDVADLAVFVASQAMGRKLETTSAMALAERSIESRLAERSAT